MKIRYDGPAPIVDAHMGLLWEPGQERDVLKQDADMLLAAAHFVEVKEPPKPEPKKPEPKKDDDKPAPKSKRGDD